MLFGYRSAAPVAGVRSSIGYQPLYSDTIRVSEYDYIPHNNPTWRGYILNLILRDENYSYSETVERSVSVSH